LVTKWLFLEGHRERDRPRPLVQEIRAIIGKSQQAVVKSAEYARLGVAKIDIQCAGHGRGPCRRPTETIRPRPAKTCSARPIWQLSLPASSSRRKRTPTPITPASCSCVNPCCLRS